MPNICIEIDAGVVDLIKKREALLVLLNSPEVELMGTADYVSHTENLRLLNGVVASFFVSYVEGL